MVCRRGPGCSFHFAIGLEFSLLVFCERGTIILKDALVFATPRCRPSCHGFRLSILLRYTSTTRLVHSKHSHLSRHKNARAQPCKHLSGTRQLACVALMLSEFIFTGTLVDKTEKVLLLTDYFEENGTFHEDFFMDDVEVLYLSPKCPAHLPASQCQCLSPQDDQRHGCCTGVGVWFV